MMLENIFSNCSYFFSKNNLSEDANNDEKDHEKSVTNAINSLSTKLKLNICSTILQHINQGKFKKININNKNKSNNFCFRCIFIVEFLDRQINSRVCGTFVSINCQMFWTTIDWLSRIK